VNENDAALGPWRGTVINVHYHGATVRLEDGTLAAVPAGELAANRPLFVSSYQRRTTLPLLVERHGRHATARLATSDSPEPVPRPPAAPQLVDEAFEQRMGAYLKATEEWAPADRPPPAERHFIRKKRRAALFEARNKPT